MNEDNLAHHVHDLWTSLGEVRAELMATQTLLRVCLELLQDRKAFPEVLSAFADDIAGRTLNKPITNEKLVERVMATLVLLTPERHRPLLNG